MRKTAWWMPGLMLVMVGCQGGQRSADLVDPALAANHRPLLELLGEAEWVDLTHVFDDETLYWPTANGFELVQGPAGITEIGFYYAANDFSAAEHGGTHLDSPIHFYETGATVDQLPLDRLVGEAVVVDVSERCAEDPDYQVRVADLKAWETAQGRDLEGTIVLLRTGWGQRWPDAERYLGTAERGPGALPDLHFPALHPEAARWLAEERRIRAVGIDTASIDFGQSEDFASHVALFEHDIPVFENVASLGRLPADGFWVVALPMKIGDGTGAPARIVALLPAGAGRRQGSSA